MIITALQTAALKQSFADADCETDHDRNSTEADNVDSMSSTLAFPMLNMTQKVKT